MESATAFGRVRYSVYVRVAKDGKAMSKWRDSEYSSIIIGGEDADVVMTSVEAAEYLKMHVKTVCRLAKEKKIPAKKVGSEWRFLKSVLDKWLTQEVV
jgi:excisionase family DNA binding protein